MAAFTCGTRPHDPREPFQKRSFTLSREKEQQADQGEVRVFRMNLGCSSSTLQCHPRWVLSHGGCHFDCSGSRGRTCLATRWSIWIVPSLGSVFQQQFAANCPFLAVFFLYCWDKNTCEEQLKEGKIRFSSCFESFRSMVDWLH